MRRALALVRRPSFWLAGALMCVWTWYFHEHVSPQPEYAVFTGAEYGWEQLTFRPTGWWATIADVSDDGSRVTIGVHKGDGLRWVDTKLQLWDVRARQNITPRLWLDDDWSSLLSGGHAADDTGLLQLLSNPSCQ